MIRRFPHSLARGLLLSLLASLILPAAVPQDQDSEVVAHIASGRVFAIVGKDGIVIAALPDAAEPGARPPVFLPLHSRRVAIVLGAVEWGSPAGGDDSFRLDREVQKLAARAAAPTPGKPIPREEQNDIEHLGLLVLEPLRTAAARLHRRVELPPDSPILQVILIGHVEEYGPEVWRISYRIIQEPLRGSYYRTRVPRPHYEQLYPPEKGQPRTLIEITYPPESAAPPLAPQLQQDPRFARIRTADQQMRRAAEALAKGESHKAAAADEAALLRALLGAIAGPDAHPVLGIIGFERGMDWLLPPAEPFQTADEAKPREAGAPTLRKRP